MSKPQWIGLMDCNNFFVSCERIFRPDLRTVPTAVLSSNDGCVVARSKEIKDMGVPMGVPYFQIKKELEKSGAAVFSSNFTLYRDISRRVMEVLREEVGYVEQYSVDESFFGISGEPEEVPEVLLRVKDAVQTCIGVPVSVGAAKTKTIAKYASEVGKKNTGTAIIHGKRWQEEQKQVSVETIWGIGRKTSQKLHELGIHNVADFLSCDTARIDRLFGIAGLRLKDELDERLVYQLGSRDSAEVQKSIMSSRSFAKTTTKLSVVEDALAYHVAHVAEELRTLHVRAGWLSVMLGTSRHGDWLLRGGSAETLLLEPTNDTRKLLGEALKLAHTFYEQGVPYKKAGVVVGQFMEGSIEQGNLFAEPQKDTSKELMEAMDLLNKRFGKETVMIGRHSHGGEWQTNRQFISPNYTTKWSEIAEIKA